MAVESAGGSDRGVRVVDNERALQGEVDDEVGLTTDRFIVESDGIIEWGFWASDTPDPNTPYFTIGGPLDPNGMVTDNTFAPGFVINFAFSGSNRGDVEVFADPSGDITQSLITRRGYPRLKDHTGMLGGSACEALPLTPTPGAPPVAMFDPQALFYGDLV